MPILKNILFVLFITLFFVISCKEEHKKQNYDDRSVVARFNNEIITESDIQHLLTENDISKEDSAAIVNKYIDEWLTEMILYDAAKKAILDSSEITSKVNDYRRQLYIYYYKENNIFNEINLVVEDKEVEDFYNKHVDNYVLSTTYLKAHYLTMDASTYIYYNIWERIKNSSLKDIEAIKKECEGTEREIYSYDKWIAKDEFFKIINYQWQISDYELAYNLFLDFVYEDKRYLVKVDEIAFKGSPKPIELVKDEISQIIINKRKNEKFYQTKNKLVKDAVNSDNTIIK